MYMVIFIHVVHEDLFDQSVPTSRRINVISMYAYTYTYMYVE